MSHALNQLLEQQFPYFTPEERNTIGQFASLESAGHSNRIQAQEKVLELVKGDLLKFYRWESTPEDRAAVRRRLLNLSGLFLKIPITELRFLAHEARLTQKKTIYESYADPLSCDLVEMNSYDIKYFEPLASFFSKIQLSSDMTALDYMAGNREKNVYPHSQFTVFRKDIQQEVIAKNYLTASAEPLTQTVFITLCNANGQFRDAALIGFDLMFESAFIDFFHYAPYLSATSLVRNAHLIGKTFLMAVVNAYMELDHNDSNLLKQFPIFLETDKNASHLHSLMKYLMETLIPDMKHKIENWNKELGLPHNHQEIEWPQK